MGQDRWRTVTAARLHEGRARRRVRSVVRRGEGTCGRDTQKGGVLHFYDSTTGQKLLSHREAEQARQAALAALQAAEARIAELEARVRTMEHQQA